MRIIVAVCLLSCALSAHALSQPWRLHERAQLDDPWTPRGDLSARRWGHRLRATLQGGRAGGASLEDVRGGSAWDSSESEEADIVPAGRHASSWRPWGDRRTASRSQGDGAGDWSRFQGDATRDWSLGWLAAETAPAPARQSPSAFRRRSGPSARRQFQKLYFAEEPDRSARGLRRRRFIGAEQLEARAAAWPWGSLLWRSDNTRPADARRQIVPPI